MNRLTIGIDDGRALAETAAAIGSAMGFTPQERDSMYLGGTYFLGTTPEGEEVTTFPNHDLLSGEPAYPDHARYGVLVRIHRTNRTPEEATALLDGALGTRSLALAVEPLGG